MVHAGHACGAAGGEGYAGKGGQRGGGQAATDKTCTYRCLHQSLVSFPDGTRDRRAAGDGRGADRLRQLVDGPGQVREIQIRRSSKVPATGGARRRPVHRLGDEPALSCVATVATRRSNSSIAAPGLGGVDRHICPRPDRPATATAVAPGTAGWCATATTAAPGSAGTGWPGQLCPADGPCMANTAATSTAATAARESSRPGTARWRTPTPPTAVSSSAMPHSR